MKNIKLVASDLDRTLLNQVSEVGEYTQDILNKIMDKDILFVPCSARTFKFIPPWILNNKKIKYVVTSNGSVIYDNHTREQILVHAISVENSIKLLEDIEKINPYWTIDAKGELFVSRKIIEDHSSINISDEFYKEICTNRVIVDDFHDVFETSTDVARKIHFITKDDEAKSILIDALKKFNFIYVTSSHPINIEITDPLATKGNALKYIMDKEKISKSDAVAFGDNDNDIEMLRNVEYGIAVANATDNLKQVATKIIGHHSEEALAKFLESNLL
ncbi:HAD family hydrolase [Anaerorhabdus sp.]|uniref:HAD family hydrolase n=1 Tax=Anaerorhabdus sp. TaxID=1872524 RepID=UPI002FC895A8